VRAKQRGRRAAPCARWARCLWRERACKGRGGPNPRAMSDQAAFWPPPATPQNPGPPARRAAEALARMADSSRTWQDVRGIAEREMRAAGAGPDAPLRRFLALGERIVRLNALLQCAPRARRARLAGWASGRAAGVCGMCLVGAFPFVLGLERPGPLDEGPAFTVPLNEPAPSHATQAGAPLPSAAIGDLELSRAWGAGTRCGRQRACWPHSAAAAARQRPSAAPRARRRPRRRRARAPAMGPTPRWAARAGRA